MGTGKTSKQIIQQILLDFSANINNKKHVNVKLFCNATPPTLYNPHAFNCNPVHNIINKYIFKIHDRKFTKNMKINLGQLSKIVLEIIF